MSLVRRLRQRVDRASLGDMAGEAGNRFGSAAESARGRLEDSTGLRLARKGEVDNPREYQVIVAAVTLLVALGTVMVLSASSQRYGLQMPFKTVLIGSVIGIPVCILASRVGLHHLRRLAPAMVGVSAFLLVLVLIPGIGKSVNGARRWLGAGPLMFQPSELAKVAIVLFLSAQFIAVGRKVSSTWDLLRLVLWPALGVIALIAVEDMGTALVCVITALAISWLAGTRTRIQAELIAGMFGLVVLGVLLQPYRMDRLTAFLHPDADPNGVGFQLRQGQIAIGSGGVFGVGPGQSVQKIFYLPEAHTDFILAVIGEELGLLAILFILGCFAAIMWAGLRVANAARDSYARMVAAGVTVLIVGQGLLNVCVVLGIAPLTGVPLPFISYGPTNLVVLLAAVGLLLNVAADGGVALKSIDGEGRADERSEGVDRRGRHGGARSAGAERRG